VANVTYPDPPRQYDQVTYYDEHYDEDEHYDDDERTVFGDDLS
jgi:hypothetical protein